MSWRALLDGADAARARARVLDLAAALEHAPVADGSLAEGAAGVALWFAHLAAASDDARWSAAASAWVERALDSGPALPGPSLYEGWLGTPWLLAHLQRIGFVDGVEDELRGVDELLREGVHAWEGEFDLMNGLGGIGTYALERGDVPSARALLDEVVAALDAMAEASGPGRLWRTRAAWMPPESAAAHPEGRISLGVAHGAPGLMPLLAAAAPRSPTAARLRRDVARALAASRNANGRFPAFAGDREPARAAWCYGDLGVAAALACADADALGDALALGRAAAARPPAHVADACLCHGSASIAHTLARLAACGGGAIVEAAARRAYRDTLDRLDGDSLAEGIRVRSGRDEWTRQRGLVTGSAGVALVLLAATTAAPPAWDRALALSL